MHTLNPGRLGVDCVVECERTVKNCSSDLPAVGHLAEGSRVDRRWYLSGDRFDRGENRNTRLAKADLREQIDRVLNNIAFGVEVGKDIDRSISMNSVSGYVGTSMMNTWLIRRSVRKPVADAVTGRISSSVCRLPFINNSPCPARINSTAFDAAASL